MNKLIDKMIILLLCIVFYMQSTSSNLFVVPILIAVTISAAQSYFENDFLKSAGFLLYISMCFFNPVFLFFIPLICYDILIFKFKWLWVLALAPTLLDFIQTHSINNALITSFILIVFLMKYRTVSLKSLQEDYFDLRDKSKEMSILFEQKNKELMQKQDYEINLATLNERNRIARDIHDNVGHLLSRSMLQIGAFMTTCKDEETKENLAEVKDTLSNAMDSIRNSVHDLHEKSIDLFTEIEKLIKNFEFCPIKLEYDIQSAIDIKLKYCIITVIKEALSNIMKHSNATKAVIIFREHPALFQLVIQDNGKNIRYNADDGIGLKNIQGRVTAFRGNLNISVDKGFRIFISIPKQ